MKDSGYEGVMKKPLIGSVVKSDYHDFVIKDGSFIGRFEDMYQQCEDPWPESEADLEENPVSSYAPKILIRHRLTKIFSFGIGKGTHLAWLGRKVPGSTLFGCDISSTAVAECASRHPNITADVQDVATFIARDVEFEVLILREVIWYLLEDWDMLIDYLRKQCPGRYILVELSFYDQQNYGTDRFDGPAEFIERFPFKVIEVLRLHTSLLQREGMILIFGRI